MRSNLLSETSFKVENRSNFPNTYYKYTQKSIQTIVKSRTQEPKK